MLADGDRNHVGKTTDGIETMKKATIGVKGSVQHRCYIQHFKSFMVQHPLRPKQLELIEKTTFHKLVSVGRVHIDYAVLNWIIRSYQGNRVFLFANLPIRFTDEEVGMILGLPSSGYSIKIEARAMPWRGLADRVLFKDIKQLDRKNIIPILDKYYYNDDEESVYIYVTCLIALMFSTFLFPDTGYSFPRILLNYIDSLEDTKYFNWSRALADMILGKISEIVRKIRDRDETTTRETVGYIRGCVSCLYVWMLEHCFKGMVISRDLRPRIRKWTGSCVVRMKNVSFVQDSQIIFKLASEKNEIFKVGCNDYVFSIEIFESRGFVTRKPDVDICDGSMRKDMQMIEIANSEEHIPCYNRTEEQLDCKCEDYKCEMEMWKKRFEDLQLQYNEMKQNVENNEKKNEEGDEEIYVNIKDSTILNIEEIANDDKDQVLKDEYDGELIGRKDIFYDYKDYPSFDLNIDTDNGSKIDKHKSMHVNEPRHWKNEVKETETNNDKAKDMHETKDGNKEDKDSENKIYDMDVDDTIDGNIKGKEYENKTPPKKIKKKRVVTPSSMVERIMRKNLEKRIKKFNLNVDRRDDQRTKKLDEDGGKVEHMEAKNDIVRCCKKKYINHTRNTADKDDEATRIIYEVLEDDIYDAYLGEKKEDYEGFQNITDVEREIIQAFLHDPAERLGALYYTPIHAFCNGMQLHNLLYGMMVDDTIIDMYMDILFCKYSVGENTKGLYQFASTNVMQLIKEHPHNRSETDYKHMKELFATREAPFNKTKKIFCVIHVPVHWFLLVLDMEEKMFKIYDSLKKARLQVKEAERWADWISEYCKEIGIKEDIYDCSMHYVGRCPQQAERSVDCGVYVMKFMELICEGKKLGFIADDIPKFRAEITAKLLQSGGAKNTQIHVKNI